MDKPQIVIADDDASILRLLQSRLGNAGYTVSTCSSGDEALDLARRKKPVLLLVDWNMPGMTGLELCRKIRESEVAQEVYSILLTGNSQPEQIAAGLDAGADDYLVKPAHPAVLLARVRSGERTLRMLLHEQEYAKELEFEIDKRKQMEEKLRSVHRETKQLLEAISSVLIGVDRDGRVTAWNGTAERTLGIEKDNALGRLFDDLEIEWDQASVAEGISECLANSAPRRLDEVRFKKPDGADGFLGMTLNPLNGGPDKHGGFLLVASDITEHKILQSQLTQAQKLESIGQLAAGIAHEINTPAQYVGDNTRFLQDNVHSMIEIVDRYAETLNRDSGQRSWEERNAEMKAAIEELDIEYLKEEIPRAIEQSLEGVDRVTKIVRSMKEFSHPGADTMQLADLNKAIESTITVTRSEWKYSAEMVTDLDPALPLIPCLLRDFNQVILNMIVNAAHAITDVVGKDTGNKGTITVSTRQEGDWAEIRISDTGAGIPPEIRARVFDPFFTTKDVGKGTGQGLAIAHATVVKKHNGGLMLESEVGKGTTFIIRLPIEPKAEHQAGTESYEEAYSLR